MKDIIVAIMLAAANLQGGTPAGDPSIKFFNNIDKTLNDSRYGVAIGYCSQIPDNSQGDILFGAYTTAPVGVDGFVNIGNTWCGLRSTGETLPCPPPVQSPCGSGY